MSSIIETGIDYSRIEDVKYMRSYIMRLNDDIRYMLSNLNPEDNMDAKSISSWNEYGENAKGVSQTADELTIQMRNAKKRITAEITQRSDEIDLLLKAGNITAEINNSTEAIRISASRLHVFTDNFYLDDNTLRINGEIYSNEGNIGGFVISDQGGTKYLNAGSSGVISGGSMSGTTGKFRTFRCAGTSTTNRSDMLLEEADVYLYNCKISSNGMYFDGDFNIEGNLDAALYVPATDMYTDRRQILVDGQITADENIWVEIWSGTTDSGLVQCYSVFSYIAGGEYSDLKLKEDISEIDGKDAVGMIRKMNPVHYQLKEDDSKSMGFIAQDIAKLQEEYGDYGMLGEDEDGLYTLSYTRFIPIMAAALKEIDKEIHGSN